jgi:hypothetical protein
MIQYDGKVPETRDRDIYTTLALTPTRPLIHLPTVQSYQISIGRSCILRSPSLCAEYGLPSNLFVSMFAGYRCDVVDV